ncbi:MAG: hypothetical protein AB8C13_09550 [Phycisphaerales bacterium]
MKKLLLILGILIPVGVIAVLIGLYFSYMHTQRLTPTEVKEVTPDWSKASKGNWSPWYKDDQGTKTWNPAASFNAWLTTVPEEDKAWPVMVDLWYANLDFYQTDGISYFPQELHNWDEFADVMRLDSNRELIDRAADAMTRPVMGAELVDGTGQTEHDAIIRHGLEDQEWNPDQRFDTPASRISLPALSAHRSLMNIFKSSALVALVDGDPDRFVYLMEVSIGSAKLALEYPTMISQLVHMAIIAQTLETIQWALQYHPDTLDETHLDRLDAAIKDHADPKFIWQGEAVFFHDAFRRIGGPDGKLSLREQLDYGVGQGLAIEGPAANIPDSQLDASIARPLLVYNRVLSFAALNAITPWRNRTTSSYQIYLQQTATMNASSKTMLDIMLPAMNKMSARMRQQHNDISATRTAIAVYRYRAVNGDFPEQLDMVQADLTEFPDEFTGLPLLYKKTNDGPVIYSVGNNLEDEDGQQSPDGNYKWIHPRETKQLLSADPTSIEGDFVYFPSPPLEKIKSQSDEELEAWERENYNDD